MLSKNSEYKAITNLSESIKKANELRAQKEELEEKIEKKRAIKLSDRHKSFPYGQLVEEKEEILAHRNVFHHLVQWLSNMLIYGALLALPLILIYLLDLFEIFAYQTILDNVVFQIVLAAVYLIILVVVFKTFIRFNHYFIAAQYNRRDYRYNRKHRKALGDAYEETKDLIADYRRIIDAEIDDLEDELSKVNSELNHTEKTIENNAQVPTKYIKHIDKIITYFEDIRAKTTQEAINLLVKEQREDQFFDDILKTLKINIHETKGLKSSLSNLQELAMQKSADTESLPSETDEFLNKVQKTKQKRRKTKKEIKAEKKANKKVKKEDKTVAKINKSQEKSENIGD